MVASDGHTYERHAIEGALLPGACCLCLDKFARKSPISCCLVSSSLPPTPPRPAAWLTTRGTSPLTGEPLADTRLLPNHTLVAAMRAVLGDHVCAGRKHE